VRTLFAIIAIGIVAISASAQRDTRNTINAIGTRKATPPPKRGAIRKPTPRRPSRGGVAKRPPTARTTKPVSKPPSTVATKQPEAAPVPQPTPRPVAIGPMRYTGAVPPTSTKPGDIWVNPRDGAELIYIPAGTFTMGDAEAMSYMGGHLQPVEQKPHDVALDDFWIYRTHVTVGMYEIFCRATARQMPDAPSFNPSWGLKRYPIVNVSWNDARDYAAWAAVTLPTEAQWERAARGPQQFVFAWGNTFDRARLWCSKESEGDSGGTTEVGAFPPNPFGVFDMTGQTWQWCRDYYDPKFYNTAAATGLNAENLSETEFRALRGATWRHVEPKFFRTTLRNGYKPADRYDNFGFRCSFGP
jgi:formylglycine-generating enzyme